MFQVAVCEDNPAVQKQFEEYLEEAAAHPQYDIFSSGEELLKYQDKNVSSYQIYFLDIALPGINGIETASQIRSRNPYALLIFVTDYKEYVWQVFEVLPFRFLTKPVEKASFFQVLYAAYRHLDSQNQLFIFHIKRDVWQIPFSDIYYFESALRQIVLVTSKETYRFYGKISALADTLDETLFVMPHHSYLVNMEYIQTVTDTSILLQSGHMIPISRRLKAMVRQKHLHYLKWRIGK